VQVFVSEYTANTILYAMHHEKLFEIDYETDSTVINNIFDRFEEVYGK
jgi:CMP-N-acetylneuraminic acid synthetase